MDLKAWLMAAHTDLRTRLVGSVIDQTPTARWADQADGGGSSITWLLLHLSRHQDLALTAVIRNKPPLFADHAAPLGIAKFGPGAALGEREQTAVSHAVDTQALLDYVNATFDATDRWLRRLSAMALDTIPDTARRLQTKAQLDPTEFDWLFRMWNGRTVDWFVQWPILGHGQGHVGEAIAVRNRLGFSPF
jgi:DinB superfamily